MIFYTESFYYKIHWADLLTRPFLISDISKMAYAIDINICTDHPIYIWDKNLWKISTVTIYYPSTCHRVWFNRFARKLGGKFEKLKINCNNNSLWRDYDWKKHTFVLKFVIIKLIYNAERDSVIVIIQTGSSRVHVSTSMIYQYSHLRFSTLLNIWKQTFLGKNSLKLDATPINVVLLVVLVLMLSLLHQFQGNGRLRADYSSVYYLKLRLSKMMGSPIRLFNLD